MKQLLDSMIWCWISDVLIQEYSGRGNTQTTHDTILAEAEKRCLVPLRDAGIIKVWKIALTPHPNGGMYLKVDVIPAGVEANATSSV